MKSHKYIEKTIVRQQGQADCGVACLASLLAYYGGYSRLERLRELSGTDPQGTSLLGLYQAASQIGFDAEGMEADSIENLKTDISEPVILHVIIDNGPTGQRLQHYIVCYGWDATRQLFIIGDPAQGLLTYTTSELASLWSSRILLTLTPNATLQRQQDEQKAKRRWLLSLISDDTPLLAISTGLGIITAGLCLSTAIFSQKLIDDILPKHESNRLMLGLLLLTFLLVARAVVSYLRDFLLNRQSRDFNNRIINRFYEALLYLPKSFFDSRKTGELIARLNDTGRIQRAISHLTGTVVINVLVVLVSAGYLFTFSVWIGLLSLLSIPLYGGLVWRYHQRIIDGQRLVMAASAHTESNYVDTIQGIDVIKATNREAFFSTITKAVYGNFQNKVYSLTTVGLRLNLSAELISILLIAGLLAVTSFLVVDKSLQLGEMMAILTVVGSILPAVASLAMTNLQIQEANVAFERMYEYAHLNPEYPKATQTSVPNFRFESLTIDALNFRFAGRPLLLENISLSIQKGEMIALFGESGHGKSTLLQLIQRFYTPESGQIMVNGTDWHSIDTALWRQSIGVVPQHIKLFNGTLLDNIGLGDTATDAEQIVSFCQEFGFDHYFETFAQGYLTLLGEEGINLSGGQRQLVALARAFYQKPQLLLLDEPTAAMDKNTEQFVMNLLQNVRPQMAILLITHKPSLAHSAKRVYSIANGQSQRIYTNYMNENWAALEPILK
ncbi:peptidase domain-containing ABC transporter [Spirosoma sp.]|uniref:peptidase domain-containing ABC transporter n=1 Tax=Spirosoma sp. TaxID=1899569 RepID=UPI002619B2F2|nr:peptidase domain-containing ABC transporter [Spirosoma sp.]MCX6215432.1 peptidase domain-containing ABC transporter [Spirosoma sp.]